MIRVHPAAAERQGADCPTDGIEFAILSHAAATMSAIESQCADLVEADGIRVDTMYFPSASASREKMPTACFTVSRSSLDVIRASRIKLQCV